MRDKKTAQKSFKKAIHKHGRPEVFVTDRLQSCGAVLKAKTGSERSLSS